MEHIQLPTTIAFHKTDNPRIGEFVMTPCSQGYGTTLGNALRRVLLSSLPGAAVESVKITGVQHEFSAIEGVEEDVVEIILNLKQLAVRVFSDEPVVVSLKKKGKGVVTAKDIEKNSAIEIVNPDLVLAHTTDNKTTLEMDIIVGRGRGYLPVAQKNTKDLDLGTIAIDSLYTPIRDVGYNVEMTRVGDVTNYEKLTMMIETNGTITPEEAVTQATQILMEHFALILESSGVETEKEEEDEESANKGEKDETSDESEE